MSTNYCQTIPDSQWFGSLDMIINYVKIMKGIGSDINYLIVGLENTKKQGYELKLKEKQDG